ncbi:hypothetical protein HWB92_gp143 [Serratia phage vB_SmaA_3M]|uniref:Uncharacterized protein n=1 Tax=Serratia phage vB_SmaA_3M TaxID=2419930 RepID=A0A3G2YSD2_9CAUD|nr:hypothetical protein HWB92_gp143 [Serratia phage vB_SmaA_3M]AYP28401.1 hypothetical protein 3M_145 [Serratia phage vB_SmaA_3M]
MILLAINILTIVLLTVAGLSFWAAVCNFVRSQFMMLSFYTLTNSVDNERAAMQAEGLRQFGRHASISFARAAWSLIAVGVIILVRYIAGVVLNAYL